MSVRTFRRREITFTTRRRRCSSRLTPIPRPRRRRRRECCYRAPFPLCTSVTQQSALFVRRSRTVAFYSGRTARRTDGRTDGRRRCIVHAPADPKRTYIFICECCKTLVPIGRRDDWIPGTTGQNDFAGSLSIIPVVEGFSDISRVYIGCTIRTRASRCRSKYRRYAFTCRVLFFRP